MAVYFVDSSALVKRYRDEAGSPRVAELLGSAERLIVSRLTQVEVSAAIMRRGRATGALAQELAAVLATLDLDLRESFDVIELGGDVIDLAVALTRKHGLRAADALQLASALLAGDEPPPHQLAVLGSDQELNAAALAEGLSVVDPTGITSAAPGTPVGPRPGRG